MSINHELPSRRKFLSENALGIGTVALAWLLFVLVSNWFTPVIDAVLTIVPFVPVVDTVAATWSVALPLPLIVPIVQTPVFVSNEPCEALTSRTPVRPDGVGSVSCTPVAVIAVVFVTVIV